MKKRNRVVSTIKHVFSVSILGAFLVACNVEELSQFFPNTLSGSVGDGPIIQAQITVTDANGTIVGGGVSDNTANYSIGVSGDSTYPILVTATGGTDVVTNAAPDFTMVSVATDSTEQTVNINPFSTVIVKTAQAMAGGMTAANLAFATQYVVEQLNFGLDLNLVPNPINTSINEANVASIIKASEAFAEAIRRTRSEMYLAGTDISENEIILAIAADMTDGVLDGLGVEGADTRIAATANIVSAQVLVETIRNHLHVYDTESTASMDSAITLSIPSATMTTADVMITGGMLKQTQKMFAAAQAFSSNSNLSAIAAIVAGLSANSLSADIDGVFPLDTHITLGEVVSQLPGSTDAQLELINAAVRVDNDTTPTPTPVLVTGAFEFSKPAYSVGESDGTLEITINRVGGSDGEATIEWRTWTFNGHGTADFNNDYVTFVGKTTTFADGETSKLEKITILSDTVVEGNETFELAITGTTSGTTLADNSTVVVTIVDDDVASTPTPTPAPTPAPNPVPSDRPWENLVNQVIGFGRNTTGGKGGEVCWVNNLKDSGAGSLRSCAESVGPKWIRFSVSGTINLASRIFIKSDKTIDGRGANITIARQGVRIADDKTIGNIIIHNVTFADTIGNAPLLRIDRNSKRIWIDHVTFTRGGDDALSIGTSSVSDASPQDITVSWCKWVNTGKGLLVGYHSRFTGDVNINVTVHHNFFNGNTERVPRLRNGKLHFFNNYLYNWRYYGAWSTVNGQLASENNIYEAGNSNKDAIRITALADEPVQGLARSKGDRLLGNAKITERLPGNVFNPSTYYSYTLEPTDDNLRNRIMNESGWQDVPAP